MNDDSQLANLGLEVAVGDIDRQLVRLFNGDGETDDTGHAGMARASLLNLAVYSEDPSKAPELSGAIEGLTNETACRAILILADPSGSPSVRSWIQAHCRLSDQGEKTVCTEQVSFLLSGADASLVRNTVFAHLDSDLPLVFWWRGELSDVFEDRLYSRVDRFIFDSGSWRQPATQLLRLQKAIEESGGGFVCHDLAYTRCHPVRSAIARVFDDPLARRALDRISGFEIVHHPGHRLSALWLIAWIAGRLGGRLSKEPTSAKDRFEIECPEWNTLTLTCREEDSPDPHQPEAIGKVEIQLGSAGRISIQQAPDSGFWRVTQSLTDTPERQRLFPGHSRTDSDLIGEILVRAGINRAMADALPILRQLAVR